MGFLDFLKAKKGQKKEEAFESPANFEQLPQLSTESELYSELPNLPEAPETQGLPEIELPPPLKGLGEFDFPEGMGGESSKKQTQSFPEMPEATGRYKPSIEPLIPEWPRANEPKLPDLPAIPEAAEGKPWDNTASAEQIGQSPIAHSAYRGIEPMRRSSFAASIPAEVPELQLLQAEQQPSLEGGLISHRNNFFLKSEDFRMVKDDIEAIIRAQKKHHKLTDIKKEENSQFEHMSLIIEDMQRKLMHVDRTLFE